MEIRTVKIEQWYKSSHATKKERKRKWSAPSKADRHLQPLWMVRNGGKRKERQIQSLLWVNKRGEKWWTFIGLFLFLRWDLARNPNPFFSHHPKGLLRHGIFCLQNFLSPCPTPFPETRLRLKIPLFWDSCSILWLGVYGTCGQGLQQLGSQNHCLR